MHGRLKSDILVCSAVVIIACSVSWLISQTVFFKQVELWTVDSRLKGSRPEVSEDIVLILLDEKSTSSALGAGKYPFSREHYIPVIQRLGDARIIAFSTIFSSEIDSWDKWFSDVTSRKDQIIHTMGMSIPAHFQVGQYEHAEWAEIPERHAFPGPEYNFYASMPEIELPFRDLLLSTPGLGHGTFIADMDQITRRVPLIVKYSDRYYPALGLILACKYLGASLADLEIRPGRYIAVDRAKNQTGAIKIPIDDKGRMWINYVEDIGKFPQASFYSVWESGQLYVPESVHLNLPDFAGKIVLVGRADDDVAGMFKTPRVKEFYTVGIHASIVNSIISEQFIRDASSFWNGLFLFAVVAVLAVPLLRFRWRWYFFAILFAGAFAGLLAVASAAFSKAGVLLNITSPALGGLFSIVLGLGWRYRERIALEATRYKKQAEELEYQKNLVEEERQKLITAHDILVDTYSRITGESVPREAENVELAMRDVARRFEMFYNEIKEQDEETRLFIESAVPHDLLHPLNSIEGMLRHPAKVDVDQIREYVDEAKQLVEKIFEWNKLKTIRLNPRPHKLKSRIIQYAVASIEPGADSRNIDIEVECPFDDSVFVDANQIQRVFANVLDNALKYTPEGGSIRISVSENEDYFDVEIADTGPGISPQETEEIFKPYHVEERANIAAGLGLGLAIAKRIVESHGGNIKAIPGPGGRFIITLPKD
jgi:signal transduction histidine kinase